MANWIDGLSINKYRPVPAACLNVWTADASNTSSMSRLPEILGGPAQGQSGKKGRVEGRSGEKGSSRPATPAHK